MDEKKKKKLLRMIEEYTKKIEKDLDNILYFFIRGNTFYKLDKFEEALKDYDKAIELDPSYTFVYNNRGNAF